MFDIDFALWPDRTYSDDPPARRRRRAPKVDPCTLCGCAYPPGERCVYPWAEDGYGITSGEAMAMARSKGKCSQCQECRQ